MSIGCCIISTMKTSEGKITFIDLFAGIGGFHLALHNLGAKCVFAAEWDDKARETYRANFEKVEPSLFLNGSFATDITKVPASSVPSHNILCAGFPCQPFSVAGQKLGFEDTRGTLFFNIAEIIKEKQPDAFFLENVRGLKNHDGGRTFEVIRATLEGLGYSFYWQQVKASDFGLPQHRPRLFMVGFREDYNELFSFPQPVPLDYRMKDVFEANDVNKEIGFTLRVGGRGSKIDDRRNWEFYLVDGELRRITPKEGKRMQGFPDSFALPVSEVQAMKQLGNSVAVPAVQMTAERIIETINLHRRQSVLV